MPRWTCLAAVGLVMIVWIPSDGVCDLPEGLSLKAHTSIRRIQAGGRENPPLEIGSSGAGTEKSMARAMLLSALVPGLGQMYAGRSRGHVVGGAMAATDMFSVWRYFVNDGAGDDKRSEYQDFAHENYSREKFDDYARDVIVEESNDEEHFGLCYDASQPEEECRRQIDEAFPLSKTDDAFFYDQIADEDIYVFGWSDWEAGTDDAYELWRGWTVGEPIPGDGEKLPRTTPKKEQYKQMRKEADDYYSRADVYAWIMVVGRVVSMIDAAILVKLRNRDLVGLGDNPRLTFKAKFGSNPSVRVGLKMRF
jgi:hypothetical protein